MAPDVVIKPKQEQPQKNITLEKNIVIPEQKEEPVIVQRQDARKSSSPTVNNVQAKDNKSQPNLDGANDVAKNDNINQTPLKREILGLDVNRTNTNTVNFKPFNKTIKLPSVTSDIDSAYNNQNNPIKNPEADWAVVENEKKTKGKGFLRKVSRFIERNTGIGTVNADNELLVGAVALKLK